MYTYSSLFNYSSHKNKDVLKWQQVLKDQVKVTQQESYTYKDPITEFVECLYVNFDVDGAQKKVRECKCVLENKFLVAVLRILLKMLISSYWRLLVASTSVSALT